MTQTQNKRLVLIAGEPAAGKSASLMNLREPEKKLFLNCEAGKDLPFPAKFQKINISDPKLIPGIFQLLAVGGEQHDNFDTVIIDTIDFMMEMYESVHIIGSSNTQQAWGDYNQFFKNLLQQDVAQCDKSVIMLAHNKGEYDEKILGTKYSVPVKGALKNTGVEAFFSIIVYAKRLEMKELKPYIEMQANLPEEQRLLRITEDDEIDGFKHVFQTRLTKQTTGERIRSPLGLFTRAQTFMDNDAQLLLDHVNRYYNA